MILKIEFDDPKGYVTQVAIQEFEGKILDINGDKQMLYSLEQVEDNVNLKIFHYNNDKLSFLNQIDNI